MVRTKELGYVQGGRGAQTSGVCMEGEDRHKGVVRARRVRRSTKKCCEDDHRRGGACRPEMAKTEEYTSLGTIST